MSTPQGGGDPHDHRTDAAVHLATLALANAVSNTSRDAFELDDIAAALWGRLFR